VGWRHERWSERSRLIHHAVEMLANERALLAALLMIEVGKTRTEAVGEVNEAVAFGEYYCQEIENANGFEHDYSRSLEQYGTRDVLRPYGVWAVLGPFNFPVALTVGPALAALLAGNAVVVKPAIPGGLAALAALECVASALPPGVLQVVTGNASA